MPYIALSNLRGRIPEETITEALDDDGDDVIDAWTDVEVQAAGMVDAYLATRYPTPIPHPLPAVVKEAAIVFACDVIYKRRGRNEHPMSDDVDRQHKLLLKISEGRVPLALEKTGPLPGAVVTFPSTLGSPGRRLM